MTLTGEQLRGARAMVRMEQGELASRAGVSVETVKRFERIIGPVSANTSTLKAVQKVLEDAGAVFLDDDGRIGLGVRLRTRTLYTVEMLQAFYMKNYKSLNIPTECYVACSKNGITFYRHQAITGVVNVNDGNLIAYPDPHHGGSVRMELEIVDFRLWVYMSGLAPSISDHDI